MADSPVLVVGAGIGGLACAIDLAASGERVRLIEQSATAGGKARTLSVGNSEVDAGPTVLTMPWVFDELFDCAGADFREAVSLTRAEVLARHFWPDGSRLDLFHERRQSADAIGTAFGPASATSYLEFCEYARTMYEVAESSFLRSQRLGFTTMVRRFGLGGLTDLVRLDPHRTMWRALERHFRSAHLRQLFGRYATYVGSSPFEAPATLSLIAHVEEAGVYRAQGGVAALVSALVSLARSLGVEIAYGQTLDRVLVGGGRVTGALINGEFQAVRAIAFNGDVSAVVSELGESTARAVAPTPRHLRSLSAVTWAMEARVSGQALLHHNVFFAPDSRAEFHELFRKDSVPRHPTVYVCAQDRGDTDEPRTCERLLILVNAPANGDDPGRWIEQEGDRCTQTMQHALATMGLSLEPRAAVRTTPADYHRLFPATGGALYGPRLKGGLGMLSRSGAATKLRGLYLVGGSVHPGAGMPMAALSGRLAAEKIRGDRALIGRSAAVATNGITSTA